MAHDTHFLERLKRVDPAQTERALQLYRDPELVRNILAEVQLPEGIERVALALEPAAETPHVIVARNGHFVTCLGAGMSVGQAQVIGAAKVDAAMGRLERVRAARHAFAQLSAEDPHGSKAFLGRFHEEPRLVSREDMQTLVAMQPLTFHANLGSVVEWLQLAHRSFLTVEGQRLRGEQRRSVLHLAGTNLLRAGNDLVLVASHGAAPFRRLGETVVESFARWLLAFSGRIPISIGLAMRIAWALGHLGRSVLPVLKERRQTACPHAVLTLVDGALGVMAVAHPSLQAEILKTLKRKSHLYDAFAEAEQLNSAADTMSGLVMKYIADETLARAGALEHLNRFVRETTGRDDDLDARSGAWLATSVNPLVDSEARFYAAFYAILSWLGRVGAPDLYLPQRDLAQLVRGLSEDDGEALLEEFAKTVEVCGRAPVRVEPKPGRNEPCACGSGKKAKRCCAA